MRFLQLSNVCQSILSNVNRSRLYQRKAASNAKHVSVHVSPVYANSVSELVKPLDIVNLSVPVMQVNPLVILFLILLEIVSQLSLFVNFLIRTKNVLTNYLLIIRAVANMILQNI